MDVHHRPRQPDVPRPTRSRVYGFREKAAFFGHNAPKWASLPKPDATTSAARTRTGGLWDDPQRSVWVDSQGSSLGGDTVYLDREVQDLEPKSWAVFETATGAAVYYVSDVSAALGRRLRHLRPRVAAAALPARRQLAERGRRQRRRTSASARPRRTCAASRSTLVELPIDEPLMKGDTEIVLDAHGVRPRARPR